MSSSRRSRERDDSNKESSSSSSRRKKDKSDRGGDRAAERSDSKQQPLQMHTALPHLLLAFSYFDQSHTGYLLDKDAEEIMHTIGLHLSRSQVCVARIDWFTCLYCAVVFDYTDRLLELMVPH